MAIYQFPGTNFHDLNLDWLLTEMKNCLAEWAQTRSDWESLLTDNTTFKETIEAEWEEVKTYITNYFANLDVTQEVSNKIDAMANDGSLLAVIFSTVAETTADAAGAWLAGNITQETGYVLDSTLTVDNAAANAKSAGVAIASVAEMAKAGTIIEIPVQWKILYTDGNSYGWQLGYWSSDGSYSDSTGNIRVNMKIRTTQDANARYPALFYRAWALAIQPPANMPNGTTLKIYEFTSGVLTHSYDITERMTIPIVSGCEYTIHTRGSGGAVSTYINQTTFDNMNAVLYCYKPDDCELRQYDFLKTVNQASYNKHGWTVGNGDTHSSADASSSLFNPIRWGFSGNRNYYGIRISFVDTADNPNIRLYANMYYYDTANRYIATIRLVPGNIMYFIPGFRFMFVLTNLTQSVQTALDSGWIDENVKVEMLTIKEFKYPYFREFDRFYTTYDANWPERGTSDSEVPASNDSEILCALALPREYSIIGDPIPVVMFCHGANGYIDDTTWYGSGANMLAMIRALTGAGYAVFDVNNTHNNPEGFADWGCLPLVRAYYSAWQYIKKYYNVEDKLFILSASMGTMANLSFMKMFGNDVIASMTNAPRVGLINRYETATDADYKKQMLVAYGLAPESALSDSTYVIPDSSVFDIPSIRGFAHGDFIPFINNVPYVPVRFPPIKAIIGASDVSYNDEEIANFYAGIVNAGNIAFARTVTGLDHGEATFLSVGELRDEMIEWFNSFRK